VAALGEILRRFRFHGVPGAPAAAAVPIDRGAELEAELAPIFSALEATELAAAEVVAAARRAAAKRRSDASEEARQLVQAARAGASAARAGAAATGLQVAAAERSRVLAAGLAEAERVGRVASGRTPALVDEVVRQILRSSAPATASPREPPRRTSGEPGEPQP